MASFSKYPSAAGPLDWHIVVIFHFDLQLLLKFPQLEDGFLRIENAFHGKDLDAESTGQVSSMLLLQDRCLEKVAMVILWLLGS